MWIVPKTLSAFVQDTEGLNLDLEERAWMLESSAMWRSKPSSKQTWLRRLKKDSWMTHLSTRILKPSQQKSFEEKFVASWEDIHVSRSVARESEKERKTQDTCGHTSEAMSGQLDLFGAFSKMSEVTPRWGYGESCPIWKKMVTERSGDCTQRRKQARLTNASDASSWQNYPTPTSRDWKGKQANEYKDERGEENNMKFASLPGVVDKISKSNWATPNTMDHLPSGISGSFKESLTGRRKRSSNLREQVNPKLNWPTASASDTEGGTQADRVEWTQKGATLRKKNKPHMTYGAKLRDAVENHENWPTPRAGNPGSRKPGTGGKILAEEAKKNWATPQGRDHLSAEPKEKWEARAKLQAEKGVNLHLPLNTQCHHIMEEQHAGPPAPEKSSTSGKNHGSPKLNPNWVEQLMGLPVGWTQLPTAWTDCASSEMALSAKPQN